MAGQEPSRVDFAALKERFEDGIFSAINERRKKIHALEGESPIDDQDAFVIYTLTEIVARDLMTRGGGKSGTSASPQASVVPEASVVPTAPA